MKTAIVTGGTGFVGMNLVEALLQNDYSIYMTVRKNSIHNARIPISDRITVVSADLDHIELLKKINYKSKPEIFFHLAWPGAHNDFQTQYNNIDYTIRALNVAKEIGCRRFVCTGSQAEYGLYNEIMYEYLLPKPMTSYGAAKVAACQMSKNLASQLGIEWVWGRIFSVYGKYEPETTLLSYLHKSFINNENPVLTKCEQNWDYLFSSDVADAIIALAENGCSGEIYNIANGNYKKLKRFVEDMKNSYVTKSNILYEKNVPYVVSLSPSISKIIKDTGWSPKVKFLEGIKIYNEV